MNANQPYRQLAWSAIAEGDELPLVTDHIDVARVVASAASTWTFFGGHIDEDYARNVQGRDHIYLATGPILGLLDCHVTSWAGPEAFLAKRSIRMVESIYAGDDIRVEGKVVRKWVDDSRGHARRLVQIDLHIAKADGTVCVTATAVWELP